VSWAADFRARFRHHPAAIGLRAVRRAGWRGLLAEAPLARRILATAPVRTDAAAGAPAEVHLLCHRYDHLLAIWALKTFYHFSRATLPLAIHLQGRVPRRLVARLRAHFPAARIIPQAEADARVREALRARGLPRLLAARAANPACMKLADFIALGRTPRVLGVDSDVLFFAPPTALLEAAAGADSLFQRDLVTRYTLTPGEAFDAFGVRAAPAVNTGLMAFTRDDADLARCERYLAHPGLSAQSGVLEQTLHALCASERGPVAYLPADYLISLEPGGDYAPLVARHYAGPSRRMVGDGMRWLEARGALREMGA
jgi:hypothetical protein